MAEELQSKGINVNVDSLVTRVKNPKRISELEEAQDKKAKEQLGLSSDSDNDDRDLAEDGDLKMEEQDKRGRKEKREALKPKSKSVEKKKSLLGKRKRQGDSDDEMVSDDSGTIPQEVRGSLGKNRRSMTPA